MSNQYRLVGVGNAELVAGLSKLVGQSNSLTAHVLAHLVELEERQLHLELGFPSLFAYCVEGLGMSEGAAGRRVAAARVCRRFSDVFERVARGELHLCALCALASHLNEQNATELFEASKGKTRRQIEELLAARFPRPDVREQIRRLPAAIGAEAPKIVPDPALGEVEPTVEVEPTARAEPMSTDVRPRPRGRELEPLSTDRFGVHFTADAELRELIERARELASHRVPNGDLASLMKLMVASFVKQEEKRRFGIGSRPRRARGEVKSSGAPERATPPGGAQSRYLAVQVRRDVHARDAGQCAYVSPDGRRCNARAFIEIDHVEPFARNGSSEASNLRLLCKAHNLLHARKCFGKLHVSAKIAARNRGAPGAPSS
ncbi:MAG TPA: HNH endonuclease signature motif containing protein [Polyangiaceae bacterium]|nr:HNH endonuclease signature motif containing protein [Polyangiaceae bacterium]